MILRDVGNEAPPFPGPTEQQVMSGLLGPQFDPGAYDQAARNFKAAKPGVYNSYPPYQRSNAPADPLMKRFYPLGWP